ncbi:hypothetical protein B0H12DRAFT_1122585, partial [Mycena haematopus]
MLRETAGSAGSLPPPAPVASASASAERLGSTLDKQQPQPQVIGRSFKKQIHSPLFILDLQSPTFRGTV